MNRSLFAVTALAMLIAVASYSATAEPTDAGKLPPIVPASGELPIRGVPAYPIHLELEQCLKDAEALLGGENGTLHVRMGTAQRFSSPDLGFILRADFTRDDVLPPLINRVVCWHTGQLIASRISAPPLSPEQADKALAVPQALPRRK